MTMESKNPDMAAQRTFKVFVEQELGKFSHFVIYALLEWFLILVLFIDGFLAFFAKEYAKFFELRVPCLLCTRIDHVFLRKRRDLYLNETICDSHRKHVSSLAFCHIHKKLSDIRTMCEGCLLSFATGKESSSDTYKSLVGILHKDIELFFVDEEHEEMQFPLPPGKRDDVVVPADKSHVHRCSCCGGPLKGAKSKGKNAASSFTQAPTPSPRSSAPLRHLDLPPNRFSDIKYPDNDSEIDEFRKEVKGGGGMSYDEMNDDRTPSFLRGNNKFFGIPLTDSATTTPRWAIRCPKKSALDRAEFAPEAAAEGPGSESATAEQDKQVRLDRKSLMDLYMELDEERNASAVAANNAMAMITRLQAEKAAVQMEALQYQRMMEEEAEYDEEAIQLLRDELRKKDRHIKHLENEIEAYRIKYGDLTEDRFVMDDEGDDDDFLEMDERSEFATPTYISTEVQNIGGKDINFKRNGSSRNLSRSLSRNGSGRGILEKNLIENTGGGGGGEGIKSSNKFGGLRRLKHLEKKKQQGSSSDEETEEEIRMNMKNESRARVRTVEEEDDFFRDDELFVEVDNGSNKGKLVSEI
ncbi:Probable myosin-binding protein 6 [Linum perenne]